MRSEQRIYHLGGIFNNIHNVSLDLEEKRVRFSFEPEKISEDFIQNTLHSLGYSVLED